MQETRGPSLSQEDPLKKGMAIHSSILAWRIPWTRGDWQATGVTWGHKESDMTEQLIHTHLAMALHLKQGSQNSLTEEEMGSERLGEMPTITQPVSG